MPDNTQIGTISPDDFDSLFNDNIIPASKDSSIKEQKPIVVGGEHNLPLVDIEQLEKEPEEKKVEEIETNKEPEKVEETQTSTDVKEALKNTVNFMVEKGLWSDFEGREDAEFDDESYAELALAQNQKQIDNTVSEILDSTGEYGKAIINHIRQGNNPDEIIDIFKEHKRIESLGNIDTPDAKKQYIMEYYKNLNNWSNSKAEKWVNNLIEDDSLDAEVDEIKDNYKELHQKELEDIKGQQEAFQKEQEQRREETKTNLNKAIDEDESFTKEDKKLLKSSLFKFNKKLENGAMGTEFIHKFSEIQKDPKKYIELVHFIVDNDGYKTKLKQVGGTQAKKETWNFIKSNGAVDKKVSDTTIKDDVRTPKNTYAGTNFKFL